jgi:8-oxo-dGTP pyrophosphatase MutT (NUDIX family)
MNLVAKPQKAATVILLRQARLKGFEVFLTRRPDGMPFLGGMYCFPGGTVSKDDIVPRMLERCYGLTPKQAQQEFGAQFNPAEALSIWVAAVREVFEEVGVLLAVDESGAPMRLDARRNARLAEKHAALMKKSLSFLALLESEKLLCDLGSLGYLSHWQTPSQIARRFDTRFFVAPLPDGQSPLANSYEVAHSVWLSPDRAMQFFNRGELPLIFPTFAALRTLADFETLDSVLREFHRRRSAKR